MILRRLASLQAQPDGTIEARIYADHEETGEAALIGIRTGSREWLERILSVDLAHHRGDITRRRTPQAGAP